MLIGVLDEEFRGIRVIRAEKYLHLEEYRIILSFDGVVSIPTN